MPAVEKKPRRSYTIERFQQDKLVKLGLNIIQAHILGRICNLYTSESKGIKRDYDEDGFFDLEGSWEHSDYAVWVSFKGLIEYFPIFGIKTVRQIRNHIQKISETGVISERRTVKGRYSYIKLNMELIKWLLEIDDQAEKNFQNVDNVTGNDIEINEAEINFRHSKEKNFRLNGERRKKISGHIVLQDLSYKNNESSKNAQCLPAPSPQELNTFDHEDKEEESLGEDNTELETDTTENKVFTSPVLTKRKFNGKEYSVFKYSGYDYCFNDDDETVFEIKGDRLSKCLAKGNWLNFDISDVVKNTMMYGILDFPAVNTQIENQPVPSRIKGR